jgi:hypothetical protein
VLSCARRLQRPSDPQVFDQFLANRIKQLPYGLVCEICAASAAGQPLQGEWRRFDPVSTHQLNQPLKLVPFHPVRRNTVMAGLFQTLGCAEQAPEFGRTVVRRHTRGAMSQEILAIQHPLWLSPEDVARLHLVLISSAHRLYDSSHCCSDSSGVRYRSEGQNRNSGKSFQEENHRQWPN